MRERGRARRGAHSAGERVVQKQPDRPPGGAWRALPATRRALSEMPVTIPADPGHNLASWNMTGYSLSSMGHLVNAEGPSGVVHTRVLSTRPKPVDGGPTPQMAVEGMPLLLQRHLPVTEAPVLEAAEHLVGNESDSLGSDFPGFSSAAAVVPGRRLPVVESRKREGPADAPSAGPEARVGRDEPSSDAVETITSRLAEQDPLTHMERQTEGLTVNSVPSPVDPDLPYVLDGDRQGLRPGDVIGRGGADGQRQSDLHGSPSITHNEPPLRVGLGEPLRERPVRKGEPGFTGPITEQAVAPVQRSVLGTPPENLKLGGKPDGSNAELLTSAPEYSTESPLVRQPLVGVEPESPPSGGTTTGFESAHPLPLPATPSERPTTGTSERPTTGTSERPVTPQVPPLTVQRIRTIDSEDMPVLAEESPELPVTGTLERPVTGTSERPITGGSEQAVTGTSLQPAMPQVPPLTVQRIRTVDSADIPVLADQPVAEREPSSLDSAERTTLLGSHAVASLDPGRITDQQVQYQSEQIASRRYETKPLATVRDQGTPRRPDYGHGGSAEDATVGSLVPQRSFDGGPASDPWGASVEPQSNQSVSIMRRPAMTPTLQRSPSRTDRHLPQSMSTPPASSTGSVQTLPVVSSTPSAVAVEERFGSVASGNTAPLEVQRSTNPTVVQRETTAPGIVVQRGDETGAPEHATTERSAHRSAESDASAPDDKSDAELARRLYPRIRTLMVADICADRERIGRFSDVPF